MNRFPYGFRIVGDCRNERRLISWADAFRAYCDCDDRADVYGEAYLSAFTFGAEFRQLLDATGSTKGYAGPCWSPWLWIDLDCGDDLQHTLDDARHLAVLLCERYATEGDDLLAFFSGSKGFHLGLPTALWSPDGSDAFHQVSRRMAERLADLAGVKIDGGVYDRVRAFRAPNSRHPKSGLHKRRLTFDELLQLSLDAILKLATSPTPFDVPAAPAPSARAMDDWRDAIDAVNQATAERSQRRITTGEAPRLNRQTVEFIRDGATAGDRHRLLFSAAANLAEFGCPPALAHALLTESALDSGLPSREVARQIDCGLETGKAGT